MSCGQPGGPRSDAGPDSLTDVTQDSGLDGALETLVVGPDDTLVVLNARMLPGFVLCASAQIERADGSRSGPVPITGTLVSGTSVMLGGSLCEAGTVEIEANTVGTSRVRYVYTSADGSTLQRIASVEVSAWPPAPQLYWQMEALGRPIIGQSVRFSLGSGYDGHVPASRVENLTSTNPSVLRVDGADLNATTTVVGVGQAGLSGTLEVGGLVIQTMSANHSFDAPGAFSGFRVEQRSFLGSSGCLPQVQVIPQFASTLTPALPLSLYPRTGELTFESTWTGAQITRVANAENADYEAFEICLPADTVYSEGSVRFCLANNCDNVTLHAEAADAIEDYRIVANQPQTLTRNAFSTEINFTIFARYRNGDERNVTERTRGQSPNGQYPFVPGYRDSTGTGHTVQLDLAAELGPQSWNIIDENGAAAGSIALVIAN